METDTDENLSAIASEISGLQGLLRVELLQYNKAAAGKYPTADVKFEPTYDPQQKTKANLKFFENVGLKAQIVGS